MNCSEHMSEYVFVSCADVCSCNARRTCDRSTSIAVTHPPHHPKVRPIALFEEKVGANKSVSDPRGRSVKYSIKYVAKCLKKFNSMNVTKCFWWLTHCHLDCPCNFSRDSKDAHWSNVV